MIKNEFYVYVIQNRPLGASSTKRQTIRAIKDFHCFDIAGVPDVSNIEYLTLDVDFPTKPITKISSEPIDPQILATQSPGNSQFLYPFYLQAGETMTVTIVNTIAGTFTFDLTFFGYHRDKGLPLGGCPPDMLIYYYVFNFGTVAAAAREVRRYVRINNNFDFVGLGTVATPNAAENDKLEFKIVPDNRQEWMKDYVMANALLQDVLVTPVRRFWRIPVLFMAGETISIYCNDAGGTGQPNTEIAIFGYHVPKGLSEAQVWADYERYQNANNF